MASVFKSFKQRAKDSVKFLKDKIKNRKSVKVSTPSIGRMYLYSYSAKHKKTLPYFDAQPLSIIVAYTDDGFFGINLHYLPPKLRQILLNRLKTLAAGPASPNKKLRLTYSLLKGASKFKFFAPAFKRYLWSHVRSQFMLIPYDEWDNAIMLPTANWKGASASKVHSDSLNKL